MQTFFTRPSHSLFIKVPVALQYERFQHLIDRDAFRLTDEHESQPGIARIRSPRTTWKGTLPGGSRDHGYVVTVSAQAMDKLGAVSPAKSVDVVVEWPTLPSERAVTDASAEKLAAAESGAFCLTLVPIRPRSRGERRSLRTLLPGVRLSPPTPRFQSRRTHLDAFQLRF